jgi:transcriptional regulator NrdR family protein
MSTDAKSDTPIEDRGLRCRKCGCRDLRVVYTRPAGGAKVIRRRECRYCGQRLTTSERVLG